MASYEKSFDPWNYFYCLSISLISSPFSSWNGTFFLYDVRKKIRQAGSKKAMSIIVG